MEEFLQGIEPWIIQITKKFPYLYKRDLQQELRLNAILNYQNCNGNINDKILKLNLISHLRRFVKKERNKGIVYAPDNLLPEDIFYRIAYEYYKLTIDRKQVNKRGQYEP